MGRSEAVSTAGAGAIASEASSRLRIATTLSSDGPGGAETMILRLSEQLREAQHSVVPVTVFDGIGWLGEQYRRVGFDPEAVHISHHWIDTIFLKEMLGIIRRHRIQIVHSHEFEMAVYGAAACRIAGIPHVITMHGGLTVWKAWQRRVALRWAMRNSAASIVVSAATKTQFARDLGVRASRLSVIPNGVPVRVGDATQPHQEFNCASGEIVILAVGNLERNKGHRELLEALARLDRAASVGAWKLIIAGGRGGPEDQYLFDYVRDNGLTGRVHIATNRSDIPDLQALADIFVMPSLWEGMPMAMLEAMIAGNAVIASATGGIPEAVTHGEHGLLVRPGDVSQLTDALQRLMTDHQYRSALGKAAKQRALAEFTVQAMAEQYESVYYDALNRSRP
jgi:glycosyltransferase involved in cell wall biosynthesis